MYAIGSFFEVLTLFELWDLWCSKDSSGSCFHLVSSYLLTCMNVGLIFDGGYLLKSVKQRKFHIGFVTGAFDS